MPPGQFGLGGDAGVELGLDRRDLAAGLGDAGAELALDERQRGLAEPGLLPRPLGDKRPARGFQLLDFHDIFTGPGGGLRRRRGPEAGQRGGGANDRVAHRFPDRAGDRRGPPPLAPGPRVGPTARPRTGSTARPRRIDHAHRDPGPVQRPPRIVMQPPVQREIDPLDRFLVRFTLHDHPRIAKRARPPDQRGDPPPVIGDAVAISIHPAKVETGFTHIDTQINRGRFRLLLALHTGLAPCSAGLRGPTGATVPPHLIQDTD